VYEVLYGKDVYETEKNKLTFDVELESIYVVGDFGVISKSEYLYGERKAIYTKGPFEIVDKPLRVSHEDLTEQGFCFFAGSVKIAQSVKLHKQEDTLLLLKIGQPNLAIVKVYINNKLVKTLAWAPYEVDITDIVIEGENKIELELFSGNRNLLGPHHHANGEIYNVGPDSFTGKWSWCERTSEAVEIKESDRSKNYWRESYCFVKFGI
jgi:hypothetical protein